MRTFYFATRANGDYIFDNFPDELKYLISEFKEKKDPFTITLKGEKIEARMACKTNQYGSIYVLTTESKFINRYKYFKQLVDLSPIYIKPLVNFQNELIETHNKRNEEFIHNVTSLNTYSIQDLFSLIPQNTLTENINKQKEKVREIIDEKPNVTVNTLLNLIKYNLATKVEFSVFERTIKPCASLQKETHSIRSVILSILQIFIDDFEKKNIEVSLDACEKLLKIDYDSLFVSLYYIFDNAVKYCCPSTKFKIIFKEEKGSFDILIIMISIRIEDSEINKLSIRGYRSDYARLLNNNGHGIGMYRIHKTLKLNDAELVIKPRTNDFKRESRGIKYEANEFRIKFNGQQDWFKTN